MGALRTSTAIAARLQAAERELARLKAATPACAPIERLMPRLVDEYRELVDDLARTLTGVNVARARRGDPQAYWGTPGDHDERRDPARGSTGSGGRAPPRRRSAKKIVVAGARFGTNLLSLPRSRRRSP